MHATDDRPDPDALLARVRDDEARAARGRLKVFFGAAPGVGKTYAMLQAAQQQRAEGLDVVAGYIEAHVRPETTALLAGLEVLPRRASDDRGVRLPEFDLDAALRRRPALILVDELAHTNAPGSRHPKRWQDIEELRDAGIDVYTTVNVQHLESLNDLVEQVTGIAVRETVPDTIIENADDVEVIDLPPDELLERLREGRIYLPHQARQAEQNFFRKGNLIALRELALRRTADRVDAQMRDYREDHAIDAAWPVRERILVCIGPAADGERLVRAGRRMAAALKAEWLVAYVETPELVRLPAADRERIARTLKLAESLGAETQTLAGAARFSDDVLELAQARNVSRIVLGKPRRRGWRRWLFGSIVDAVVEGSGEIDVHVISTDAGAAAFPGQQVLARSSAYLGLDEQGGFARRRKGYAVAAVVTVAATVLAWPLRDDFQLTNLVMLYLLGVVWIAVRYGRGPSVLASVLSVMSFDFFFVPPYLTFAVSDTEYLVTFAVMLVVGLVISSLTASVRLQARVAGHRERRTAALYTMVRELATAQDADVLLRVGVREVTAVFDCQAVVLLPDADGKLRYPRETSIHGSLHGADLGIAQWVYDHGRPAGLHTDTLPGSDALYLPLAGAAGALGVLGVLPASARRVFLPEQLRLLETFAGQIALALQRVQSVEDARRAQTKAETESLRNSLLAAISHDLRTPLAVIAGSSSALLEGGTDVPEASRRELAQTVLDEARRMTRVVNNLLDMTRLESGAVHLDLQWHVLEELAGSVLGRLREPLEGRRVRVDVPRTLPLVRIDGVLIEQVLMNLVENACRYTPPGTPIEITAAHDGRSCTLRVRDFGPGLPPEVAQHVFEKFYRAQPESAHGGAGLGLTICRAIVEAHGGTISAANAPDGGAVFTVTLPAAENPPGVVPEAEAA
ncbi:MAG: DUF4118 domain-containing protein [Burkholderiales bacterium]